MEGEKIIPIGAKYTTMNSPRLPSGISSFIKEYKTDAAYVVTKDFYGDLTIKEDSEILLVTFVPAYLLL